MFIDVAKVWIGSRSKRSIWFRKVIRVEDVGRYNLEVGRLISTGSLVTKKGVIRSSREGRRYWRHAYVICGVIQSLRDDHRSPSPYGHVVMSSLENVIPL
jgi:hypothetical protein